MARTNFKQTRNRKKNAEEEANKRKESSRESSGNELDITSANVSAEKTAEIVANIDDLDPGSPTQISEDIHPKEREHEAETRRRLEPTRVVELPEFIQRKQNRVSLGSALSVKKVRIGIIMDGTLSFTTVYPKIYYVMEQLLYGLQSARQKYKGIEVEYALTILHDAPEVYTFSNGDFFTISETEVINVLRELEFYGGSADGYEDLEEAINQTLMILNNAPNASVTDSGLLLFTDSMQEKENTKFGLRFTSDEPGKYGDYTNYGLRFANTYAYKASFMPLLRIVDHYGNISTNNKNVMRWDSLQTLLEQDSAEIVSSIQNVVELILNQVSVRG